MGNRQMSTLSTKFSYTRALPVGEGYDVMVCGGGPSGIPAALAARRAGLKVLLVEATQQLGGVSTSAGISILLGGRTGDNKFQCVGGIFHEITRDLVARGGALDPEAMPHEEYPPLGWRPSLATGVTFDLIPMVKLLDDKIVEADVDILFSTSLVDVHTEGDCITHAILFNKSGLSAIPVKAVIDATGDADVAARSGCEVIKGREDGFMAPASAIFTVDRVDQDALSKHIYQNKSPRFRKLVQSLRESGEWPIESDIFISFQSVEKGTLMINTACVWNVDGTDGRSVSRGLLNGREAVYRLLEVMREYFPGFSNARIISMASALGIRETRRIVGDFVYKVEDILAARDFEDTIGFSGYGWDLSDPKRPGYDPAKEKGMTRPYTPIPYRCMVPRPVQNVICPGRAVSVERLVLGPLRVMAPCYAMGEAAGLSAVQVAENGIAFREIDVQQLRQTLRQNGAIVDWE